MPDDTPPTHPFEVLTLTQWSDVDGQQDDDQKGFAMENLQNIIFENEQSSKSK